MSQKKRRVIVSSAIAASLGILGVAAYVSQREPTTAIDPSVAQAPLRGEIVRWCADGLEPIVGGGCFAAPASASNAPLIVYLHGRFDPNGTHDELERQGRVARMGVERGYAVLALRGEQGECKNAQIPEYFCWPSNARNLDDGPRFVAQWKIALDEVSRRTNGTSRRYLLGFSNGGYFADLIATRALMPFDAIVIAHAGPVEPTRALGNMPPLLLISGDEDPSDTEVGLLDQELSRENWPHSVVAREGGHALLDWDVDMALTFFQRSHTERMPLSPPLARGRRVPNQEDNTVALTTTTSADLSANQPRNAPPPIPPQRTAPPQPAAPVVNVIVQEPPPPQQPPPQPPPQQQPQAAPPPQDQTPQPVPAGVSTSAPAGVSTSAPAGVVTDQVPSQPYWPQ